MLFPDYLSNPGFMERPELDSNNDTEYQEVVRNHEESSPEILYISKQQGGLGLPDLTPVFKQSQLTRTDILSTSVNPLIKKLENRELWKLARTGWSAFTDLFAYS
jgi:hypothetical protein